MRIKIDYFWDNGFKDVYHDDVINHYYKDNMYLVKTKDNIFSYPISRIYRVIEILPI